jgi:hypothetical protein
LPDCVIARQLRRSDLVQALDPARVVFSTELFSDLGQAHLGHFLAQVHGHLPRD